jgi:hypothetical protein
MTPSLVDADSFLVIDVGEVNTRATLFDVVDGRYRFIASGSAPSTARAPFLDVGEGVRQAIDRLEAVTGRQLIGENEALIIPSTDVGVGVDSFAATISAGAPLKTVIVGLLEDVSLQSARRLAASTYTGSIEALSLNDRRKGDQRIDAIFNLRPDIVIVTGGAEGGASQSILKLLESVGLACYLLPEEQRPEVLYAGNSHLEEEVQTAIGDLSSLHFAPNVRPVLDQEQLGPAQTRLGEIVSRIRCKTMSGAAELDDWASGGLMPAASAFGRLVRFLSKAYSANKGVMGVDVGASAATVAAAYAGDLALGVSPDLGLGRGLPGILQVTTPADIARWVPSEVSESYISDYIHQKSVRPYLIPATEEDLLIEQALARIILSTAVQRLSDAFPAGLPAPSSGGLPYFEPILASGSVLTRSPSMAQTMLTLLDGLQPSGVTTLVLDQNHISPGLGAAAAANPVLAVQVLDTNTFLYLGTVITPVGNARPGTPILRVRMAQVHGPEITIDVKQGSLEIIPLPLGQSARLHLQPLHRFDVGMGAPGRGGKLSVHGGVLGIVIDARGRPLRLPSDPARRMELQKKWLWSLNP